MYGTTTYTAAISAIPDAYDVSQRTAILGFTLPFFGVFFAPIYTPHLAERYGRRPIYFISFPLFCLCVIVIGLATKASTLLAFRFLAGYFGGPCVVLIEGTFADVWSGQKTVTYYSFLTLASYLGAAAGTYEIAFLHGNILTVLTQVPSSAASFSRLADRLGFHG